MYIIQSYIRIVVYTRKSSNALAQGQQAGAEVSVAVQLSLKVAFMIGSQLISWLSFFILVMVYNISSELPSTMVYEATAGVIMPINSLLNPIFYSSLFKKIFLYFGESIKSIFSSKRKHK